MRCLVLETNHQNETAQMKVKSLERKMQRKEKKYPFQKEKKEQKLDLADEKKFELEITPKKVNKKKFSWTSEN